MPNNNQSGSTVVAVDEDPERVLVTCSVTGVEIPLAEAITTKDGDFISQDEYDENWVTCSFTDEVIPRGESIVTADGDLISQEEYDENWVTCERSGDVILRSDACEVRLPNDASTDYATALVSRRQRDCHFSRCDYSDEYYPDDTLEHVSGYGEVWVGFLRHDNDVFFYCESCGEWYHENDRSENHPNRCCDCSSGSGVIRDYGCQDYPPIRGKGPLFYGVELEVESPNRDVDDAATEAHEYLSDIAIFKEDGSLDMGFEIVSGPMDFDSHMSLWDRFLDNRPDGIRSWSRVNCGMHVHVSRNALSGLQIGKMLVFVNHPEHRDFIMQVAGRGSDQWARFREKKVSDARKCFSEGRYASLNTEPRRTVEFRIFRSTLNKDRFKANIQFVDALVRFTAPATRSVSSSVSIKEFLKWIRGERKRYPELTERLARWGYIPHPTPKKSEEKATIKNKKSS